MLILAVPEYLDKLLENSCLAAIAPLSELCGIVDNGNKLDHRAHNNCLAHRKICGAD